LTIIGWGGGDTHFMTMFIEFLNNVHENDFIKFLKKHFGPIVVFFPTITISLSIIIK